MRRAVKRFEPGVPAMRGEVHPRAIRHLVPGWPLPNLRDVKSADSRR